MLAVVAGFVCLLVLFSVRVSRPGAPARVGAIAAGIMLLLTIILGIRAHDDMASRSDDTQADDLRPHSVEAIANAEVTGDPQSGLTVNAGPEDPSVHTAYLPDARICEGTLDADLGFEPASPDVAPVSAVSPGEPTASGAELDVRADRNSAALSVQYLPADNQVRLVTAAGQTEASLSGATTSGVHLRVALHGQQAQVWFDNSLVTPRPIRVAGGCAAVRFGAWGAPATLRALTLKAS
jgi:hypothetical protein